MEWAALALSLLLAAGSAGAWPGAGEELPGERLEGHLDGLDLDPAPRAELRELHALMDVDQPDERAVMAQIERIGQLRTEGHKLLIGTLLQIRERLTPEQRDELRSRMLGEAWERWRSRRR